MVDANARLGSLGNVAVGSGGFVQAEDDNGALFHRAVLELGLRVPSKLGPPVENGFMGAAPGGQSPAGLGTRRR